MLTDRQKTLLMIQTNLDQIEAGEIQPHAVAAELVEAGRTRTAADDASPFGPASVVELGG